MNYYNDVDPTKAAWLRQLIADGLIPAGEVDERSICDVLPADLIGFDQWHFFAGIGGWALALALAGWPTNRPVATASCPCQPFSQTGKRLGAADPRHLWPEVYRLTRAAHFPVIFGEQVSSPDGLIWFDGVSVDLEAAHYDVEAFDLCAAGVSAPHPRQRLYWVAYANRERCEGFDSRLRSETERWVGTSSLSETPRRGEALRLADAHSPGPQGRIVCRDGFGEGSPWTRGVGIQGEDRKMRRIEPGIFPLAHGLSERVALIGGAGDAIVPLLAAEFIQAAEEARYV